MYTETLVTEAWILSNCMNLLFAVLFGAPNIAPQMLLCQAILLISLADRFRDLQQPTDRPAGQRKKRFGGHGHFSHQTDACSFSDT